MGCDDDGIDSDLTIVLLVRVEFNMGIYSSDFVGAYVLWAV